MPPTMIALMRLTRDRPGYFLISRKGSAQSLKSKSKKMKIPQNPFGVETNGLITGMGLDGLNHLGVQLRC